MVTSLVPKRLQGTPLFQDLLIVFAARSLKLRYRGSVLGVFWSLSNPLLMTGLYSVIFGTAFARYYDNSILRYVLAVFAALAVLAFFTATTAQALSSIVANGSLINKVALPLSVFPISTVAANAFQLSVGTLPLLVLVTLYRTHSLINVAALLCPIIGLLMTALGFGLALSVLYVFFRDLSYLYEVITFCLYMTTPVFYPAQFVPQTVRAWLVLNPAATIVQSVREISLSAGPPSMSVLVSPLIAGAVSCLIGGILFAWLRRDLMDLI